MAKKAVPSERLTPQNLDKVISLLSAEKPITKKYACEFLGIAYNTTRLQSLIDSHVQKKETDTARRAEKKGKPASPQEISFIISEYLSGGSLSSVADGIYRGPDFVRSVLEKTGCVIREQGSHYFRPDLIPEDSVKEEYLPGEKCYSVRYQSLATIREKIISNGQITYRIWLEDEKWQQFAYQPWWELARLDLIISKFGVTL